MLYAVLLAFAVIVVWEKFSEAENVVAREASAIATLYRLADGIRAIPAARTATTWAGTSEAVAEDWPAMARGTESPATTER